MRRFVFFAAVLALLSVPPVAAQDFYRGKSLSLLVGFSAGGGYDLNARLLARHIGRHIPGNPAAVVVNMPGAGTLTLLQSLDLTAPKDGTIIGTFDFAQIANSRMAPDKVKVDFRKFAWIGSMAEDIGVCFVWHGVGVATIDALKRHGQVHMGSTNPGGTADVEQRIFKNIFKIDIHPVTGYAGSAEERLAIERGELDGGCGTWSSQPPDWVATGKIVPLIRLGAASADLPATVPDALAIAPSERDRAIIRLLIEGGELGKPFVASLAVPADRLRILRDAFAATMADPDFIADAGKGRLPIAPRTADESRRIVDEIYAAPDDIVTAAKRVLEQ
jgi:tripartite-type tricarboxylate transporter receptor subunit TctC